MGQFRSGSTKFGLRVLGVTERGCHNRTAHRQKSDALLLGKLFDDRGNRITPISAMKRGVRCRYYVSRHCPERY
jgi:hypothetical protein